MLGVRLWAPSDISAGFDNKQIDLDQKVSPLSLIPPPSVYLNQCRGVVCNTASSKFIRPVEWEWERPVLQVAIWLLFSGEARQVKAGSN